MSIRRDFPDLPPLRALAFAPISYTVGRIMPIEVMGRWRFLPALACIAAGVALIGGGASAIPVALIFPFVIDRRFVRGEERVLRETFCEEAGVYLRRSRRR